MDKREKKPVEAGMEKPAEKTKNPPNSALESYRDLRELRELLSQLENQYSRTVQQLEGLITSFENKEISRKEFEAKRAEYDDLTEQIAGEQEKIIEIYRMIRETIDRGNRN